ncbi:MAG: DNA polymerase III subunit gamma/tau [Bacteroidales bacterium]|nr:DNA polymerase III subunit gamma/tau [Bacteroidales bacterium]
MDSFIVSALKYRPATFDTVVGQSSITTTLKNAIKSEHLAHAYLFCGPRGVGKTTCARIFAKTINCKNINEKNEACNKCESCISFNENRSYNIHELDAASNNSVEDIRTLIEQTRIPPQVGRFSVYIIDEVHMLSSSAFNAFLKTLEEPPSHAIFILATTGKQKIIPTILSRCQIFDFNRIKIVDIVSYLEYVANSEGIKTDENGLNIIAQKADGAMRDALSIFDQIVSFSGKSITYEKVIENLNVLDYEYFFKLTEAFIQNDYQATLIIFNEILNNGFDGHNFITGLAKHFRDLLVCKDKVTSELLEVGVDIRKRYLNQSENILADWLFNALNICSNCDINYKSSSNGRLHVELTLLQLCKINDTKKTEPVKIKDTKPEAVKIKDLKTENIKEQEIKEIKTIPPQEKTSIIIKEDKTKYISSSVNKQTSFSIKDALSQTEKTVQEKETNNEQTGEIDNINKLENKFTQDDLQKIWTNFSDNIKEDKPRLYNTLISNIPKLTDNYNIEFVVNNSLQENEINLSRIELMKFLKDELNNQKIELIIKITDTEPEKKKLYTDSDKFDYLQEKNPNLIKFKEKLNLDFK